MKPPIVKELTNPRAHRTRRMRAMVQSMVASSRKSHFMRRASR
jgi:hypothetical protein